MVGSLCWYSSATLVREGQTESNKAHITVTRRHHRHVKVETKMPRHPTMSQCGRVLRTQKYGCLTARLFCSEGRFTDTKRGKSDSKVSQLSLILAHNQIAGAAAESSRSRRPRRRARQPRSFSPRRTCTAAGTARYTRLVWGV